MCVFPQKTATLKTFENTSTIKRKENQNKNALGYTHNKEKQEGEIRELYV